MHTRRDQEWSIVRLLTLQKKGGIGRLLFATVNELPRGRPIPTNMSGIHSFPLKKNNERLFFRRTLLSKKEAIDWYRSLNEGEIATPIPTREEDREQKDGVIFQVPKLEDEKPWPALGLPITNELFSNRGLHEIQPPPFIGSVPARLHRRFGYHHDLKARLIDPDARAFVARRMHIDLFNYPEYLGSAAYVAPDPVINQIDNFMVPSKDGHGERIIYRFVPRPNQNLEGLRVTTFDKEAHLLTSFESHQVPANGILEVDKGTCMGEYGFVVTHEQHGVLVYKPPASFIRQMNINTSVNSGNRRRVIVPSSNSPAAHDMEYEAAMGSDLVSQSTFGDASNTSSTARISGAARERERQANAKYYGQRWFPEGSRKEATNLVHKLLRAARHRVVVADPYFGSLQIVQFLYAVHGREMDVTLLTSKLAFSPQPSETKMHLLKAFKLQLDKLIKHQQLEPEVRVMPASSLHDRFLVIDNDAWFLGNSLNSFGEKASMIVKLPNPDEVIERLKTLKSKAPGLDEYISKLPTEIAGKEIE